MFGIFFVIHAYYIDVSYVICFFKVSPWKCHEGSETSAGILNYNNKDCPSNTNACVKVVNNLGIVRSCGAAMDPCNDRCNISSAGVKCICCTEKCNSANVTRGLMGLNALISISLTIIFSLM